ncbi:patatin-like phospholipase family protein [Nisaea sp.]|uniref:patatin-like phospholipase family protein n=1 Tax=Nisaea sp. TaxID=2024842 RepID=UPI0032EE597D
MTDSDFTPIASRSKDEIRKENFCAGEIYRLESEILTARRRTFGGSSGSRFAGLAISGGGIRSATFALGLLQSLARHDLLKGFDYLSTVSGGGYIGASLSWLFGRNFEAARRADEMKHGGKAASAPYGSGSRVFPFGTAYPKDRSDPAHWTGMLRFLREHAAYLAPSPDITLLSGVAVLLRGILLNLLVWIPIFILLFLILMIGFRWDSWPDLMQLMLGADRDPAGKDVPQEVAELLGAGYINLHEIILIFGALCLGWFGVVSLIFAMGTFFITSYRKRDGRVASWGARLSYILRRQFDRRTKLLLPIGVFAIAVGALPYIAGAFYKAIGSFGTTGAGALGTGLLAGLASVRKSENAVVKDLLLPAIAALVLSGGLIFTCYLALLVHVGGFMVDLNDQNDVTFLHVGVGDGVYLGFLAVALLSGYFVNTNYISLHRFYRDRLMEVFMPMPAAIRRNRSGKALGANVEMLREISDPETGAPYHLVNTNLILVDSEDSLYRRRGGDNFVMSRVYCGGDAGGFQPTKDFAGGDMTLATAMTVSGAAANPNAGVAGTGATRSRPVSWLMSLLNVRLGYWVRNRDVGGFLFRRSKPNHFDVMAVESGLVPQRETGKWYQLSDGGHFENLAIYELIRRRCSLILVSDGGADPHYKFGDLQNAVRRVSQDFGVQIEFGRSVLSEEEYLKAYAGRDLPIGPLTPENTLSFDHWRNRLSSLVPRRPTGFPVGGKAADHGFIIGTVTYPARDDGTPEEEGTIIYVKATMLDGLSLETRGYKTDYPDFPHQSTADQFFDPAQFEAYRELGNAIGEDMIKGARLRSLLGRAWGAADGGD